MSERPDIRLYCLVASFFSLASALPIFGTPTSYTFLAGQGWVVFLERFVFPRISFVLGLFRAVQQIG
jgi:hypothetical protein